VEPDNPLKDGLDYWIKFDGDLDEEEPRLARLNQICPRAWKQIKPEDLTIRKV
jgi:hypothetical protein